MVDVDAASERIIEAYNIKAFDALEALIASDPNFAHFNRDFVMSTRNALLDVLRRFASIYAPDRRPRHADPLSRQAGGLCVSASYNF